ncbi:hypothetical protein KIN20_003096 [Parelaphostrongylus tenuis]|uniref:Phosphatidic acid phosphatase type 2/haloperoxidase domain-containing protein n=1 Tax=Parelaphostrongylus tenuis TaxID=148309 RepID=A0AAD5MF52_PARTN|nr:hypothetical protein KIN20_003096 [Parelaphostrongylus tenuis]
MVLNVDVRKFNTKTIIINLFLLLGFALIGGEVIPSLIGASWRGFFCDDESIRYPYKADTITSANLVIYAYFVIIITVVATEWYFEDNSNSGTYIKLKVGRITIPPFLVRALIYIGYSQIGAACMYVVINLTKVTIGRLRPHFLDVCKPKDLVCSKNEYIINYQCTGDESLVLEARKSFFSGHSAISMYASTFAVLYLLSRIPRDLSIKSVLPILQTIVIVMGLMISFSRISDNMHHWSDVMVGIIVGVFFASYTCIIVAKMFNEPEAELLPFREQKADYVTVNSTKSTDQSTHTISTPENCEETCTNSPEPKQ